MTESLAERLELLHLSIPLRRPFVNADGPVSVREVGLVGAFGADTTGWGEASPYPGQDVSFGRMVATAMAGDPTVTLAAAIDQANADLEARSVGRSIASSSGGGSLAISLAVGLGGAAVEGVADGVVAGVNRFKVKVAPGRVDHVREVRQRYPDVVLGIDGNGSFSVATARELLSLADHGLIYVEEPAPFTDTEALRIVKDSIDVPVFADESVRSMEDIMSCHTSSLVDGVVVKPARFGYTGALAAVSLADRVGIRWRASGLLETSVGRAYTNALACRSNAFVSDVAPASWFLERDVADTPVVGGRVALPSGPGIGFDPNEEVIGRYLVGRHDISHLLTQPVS